MSAKDAFFQKVEDNVNAQKATQEALMKRKDMYIEEVGSLIQTVASWFANSPIKVSISTASFTSWDMRGDAPSLRLQNDSKVLTITPEGFASIGSVGLVKVMIDNPMCAPRRTEFFISLKRLKDSTSERSEWEILSGTKPVQRIEFDQESFFSRISFFA